MKVLSWCAREPSWPANYDRFMVLVTKKNNSLGLLTVRTLAREQTSSAFSKGNPIKRPRGKSSSCKCVFLLRLVVKLYRRHANNVVVSTLRGFRAYLG